MHMKQFLALSCSVFFSLISYSQSNLLIDTTGVSNISDPMMVCGGNKIFSVQISNISASTISDIYISYDLPTGLSYSNGSLSGTGISEYNITNINKPVFKISSILPANLNLFTFSVSADCNVLTVINNIDSLKAKLSIQYTKGGANFIENYHSTSITVYEPSISLQVSNNVVTANVGDSITRNISIVNGGSGSLSNLEFYIVSGNGINILELNSGNYTVNGDTFFISFSGTDFINYGDGDALFEQNEVLLFAEKIEIIGCTNLQSAYNAYWGCNNEPCQQVNAYSSVSVSGSTPNFNYQATASQSGCYEISVPNKQQIRIINTGNGPASNIEIAVYQAKGVGYGMSNNFYSYIADTSFTYRYGISGTAQQAVVDSTVLNKPYSCFQSLNPKAYVRVQVPYLAKGDTLYINWNVYVCCITLDTTDATQISDRYINGWNYEVSYDNQCGTNTFQSGVKGGRNSNTMKMILQTTDFPSDLNKGDTATFNFISPGFILLPGEPGSAYCMFEFIIPDGVKVIDNSVTFVDSKNISWIPDSVINNDSIVTAYFNFVNKPAKFLYTSTATTSINVVIDSASCLVSGQKEIIMNTYYVPSASCGCSSQLATMSAIVNTHCDVTCDSGGVWTYSYDIVRSSFGLADNDNNGIPDTLGVLNMDSIALRTVMYHDTLSAYFKATIVTTSTNPDWEHIYAESTFSDMDVAALDATLTIYDASENAYYTCTNIPYSQNNTVCTYYLSIDSLAAYGCIGDSIPLGFVYENGDSIWFTPRYVVVNNIGYDIYTTTVTNEFYASNIPLPDTGVARYSCDNYSGYFTIVGHVMANFGIDEYITGACDSTEISQIFRASTGPCCNNYAGGNIFPFEYRAWSYLNNVVLILPDGYNFASANYTYNQTGGTGKKITTNTSMVPDSIVGNYVYFNIEKYYMEFGGNSFFISDDGYNINMKCVVVPTCQITPNTIDTIYWLSSFSAANNYLIKKDINSPYPDLYNEVNYENITSTVPDLSITPTLSIVQATDLTASWNFNLSNNSIYSDANNIWLSFQSQSGNIKIQYLVNTNTNDTVYAKGDIFQLGKMGMASLDNYNAVCTYNTCEYDSIALYTGWNCDGYPASLDSSNCFSQNVLLYLDPQPSKIDLEIIQSPTNIDLCDTATYEVKVSSIQLGALQNITVTAEIPYGIELYNNTSELLYPNSGVYLAISDPDSIGKNLYRWNIDASSILIDSLGLKGINDTLNNYFKLRFDVTTNCDFISGFVINFMAQAEYACGPISTEKSLSSLPLEIKGAPQGQYTAMSFSIDNPSLCDSAIKCHISIINLGPSSNLSSSHYVFQLPSVYNYVPGSFINILNANTIISPVIDTLNGQVILDWSLPSSLAVGDSAVFDFYIKENASFLCGSYTLNMFTAQSGNVLCKSSGDSCSVYFLSTNSSFAIDKPKLEVKFNSLTASSSYLSAAEESLLLNFSLVNTGAVTANDTLYLSLFYDVDMNGIYSSSDYFLNYITIVNIFSPNILYNYIDSMVIPFGYSCSLVATLNSVSPGGSCGCSSDEIAYNNPIAFLNPLSDVSICSGAGTLIGIPADSNMVYNWSPSFGLSDPANSQPYVDLQNTTLNPDTMDYILTINNNMGGCMASDTMKVIVQPFPAASMISSSNTACNGDTITFSYNGSPNNYTSYNWNFGSGLVISGNNIGPYQVVFPGNGNNLVKLSALNGSCASIDSTYITSEAISDIFSNNDTSICSNNSLMLNAGNSKNSYIWSTGDTVNNIVVSVGGIYWVQVNSGNCLVSDTIHVTLSDLPDSVFNQPDTILSCANQATIGPLNSIYSYLWSTGSVNDSIIVSNSGYYSVTANNGKCELTDSIYVDFSGKIIEPFDIKDTTICSNQAVLLNAGIGYLDYTWSTGDTSNSILISSSGTYWIKIVNKQCSFIDTITVAMFGIPVSGLEQNDTIHSCTNEVNVGLIPGFSYMWSNGSTSDSIDVFSSGYYWVTVDNGICQNTDSLYVDFSGIITNLDIDNLTICDGEALDISANYSNGNYLWSTGASTQSISITDSGKYWVEVSNQHCKASDTLVVEDITDENFKVGNVFTPNGDGLNELFYTQLDNIDLFHITIWNRWGRKVFESDHKDYSWNGDVGGMKPEQGVYFWIINYNTLCNPEKQHTETGFVELLLNQ